MAALIEARTRAGLTQAADESAAGGCCAAGGRITVEREGARREARAYPPSVPWFVEEFQKRLASYESAVSDLLRMQALLA